MHSSADTSSFAVDLCLFFNLTPFRSLPWNKGAPIVLSSFARLQRFPQKFTLLKLFISSSLDYSLNLHCTNRAKPTLILYFM